MLDLCQRILQMPPDRTERLSSEAGRFGCRQLVVARGSTKKRIEMLCVRPIQECRRVESPVSLNKRKPILMRVCQLHFFRQVLPGQETTQPGRRVSGMSDRTLPLSQGMNEQKAMPKRMDEPSRRGAQGVRATVSSGSEGQQHHGKLVSKSEGKTECVKCRDPGGMKRGSGKRREAPGRDPGLQWEAWCEL